MDLMSHDTWVFLSHWNLYLKIGATLQLSFSSCIHTGNCGCLTSKTYHLQRVSSIMSKERGDLEQITLSKVIAALLTYRNRFSYQSMNSAICAVPKYGLKSLLSFAYLLSHIIDLNCHLLFFFLEDVVQLCGMTN